MGLFPVGVEGKEDDEPLAGLVAGDAGAGEVDALAVGEATRKSLIS